MATVAEALALAVRHHEAGNLQQAEHLYEQVLQADPGNSMALSRLGMIAYQVGRPDRAVEYTRAALARDPWAFADHNNLGLAYQALGNLGAAVACYRRALQLKPDLADGHYNLGNALRARGELADAAASYEQALRLEPQHAGAHHNLGLLFREQGKPREADQHFQEALRIRPGNRLRVLQATLLPPVYASMADLREWRERFQDNVRRLIREQVRVDLTRELAPNVFYLAYQGLNDRELQAEMAGLYRAPPLPPTGGPDRMDRRIRVGFLSKHFMDHTIGELTRGLIAQLSRDTFAVTVLSIGRHGDETAQLIRGHADQYLEVPDNLPAARQVIGGQRLDVLFYPDIGMEPFTYTLAFSRLAPVQCTTWGHPVTTGIPTIDYFISSELFETAEAQGHYTESLVRLRRLPFYCYRPSLPPVRKSRGDFGLPEACHLYACPQSLFKFHPEFDALLGAILRRDPRGLLALNRVQRPYYQHWENLLLERFAAVMPDVTDRILFLPRLNHEDYLCLNALSDVLLDTVHFNGGNTSLKGLALGVPIVTLPSQFLRGRLTLGLYRQMGILDCVAGSPEEYVDIAVRLGTDREYREAVRAKILAASGLLYEDAAAVRELEGFFQEAVGAARERGG